MNDLQTEKNYKYCSAAPASKQSNLKDTSELLKRAIVLPKCDVVPSVTLSFLAENVYFYVLIYKTSLYH